jgi:DNA-binding protein YbaB
MDPSEPLPMPTGNPLDRLARLEEETRRAGQMLSPPWDPDASYGGTDHSGAVRVTVDGQGHVLELHLDRSWQAHIPPDGLGAAVAQAVEAGIQARLSAWGAAVAEGGRDAAGAGTAGLGAATAADGSTRQAGPSPEQGAGDALARGLAAAAAPGREIPIDRVLDGLLTIMEQAEAGFEQLTQQLAEQAETTVTGYAADRAVVVTMTGTGQLAGVDYDPGWLVSARVATIIQATRQAFDEAYQQLGRQRDLMGAGPLGDLRRLVSDPVALARQIGLSG